MPSERVEANATNLAIAEWCEVLGAAIELRREVISLRAALAQALIERDRAEKTLKEKRIDHVE